MAVPLALENSLWYASNIISTIFIGHLGKQELASVVLGESVFNVTGLQFSRLPTFVAKRSIPF